MIKLKTLQRQLRNIRATLGNTRGETIIEAIVSMIVFAIFTLTVVTAIVTSVRISAVSTGNATLRQDQVNAAMLQNDGYTTETSLSLKTTEVGRTIDLQIPVETMKQDGLSAFRPKQGGTSP